MGELTDLPPEELAGTEQNAPNPVINVQAGGRERRSSELDDEYLSNTPSGH